MTTKQLSFLLGLFFFSSIFGQSQDRKTYADAKGWTEYMPGTMPFVLSVPHGGRVAPDSIKNRECPDAITVTDSYTIELARAIDSVFRADYKIMPHVIICNLSRKKVDMNREIEIGACSNDQVKEPWNNFHMLIDTAIAMATRQFGMCLYIDLHAQGHTIQRLEMGYLLRANELNKNDQELNSKELTEKSSMRWLVYNNIQKSKNTDLVKGPKSLGTLLAADGFPAVPSQQDPFPLEDQKYFDGGYNTRRYTSQAYPNVFGLQIETNFKGVREKENRPLFARSLAKNIAIFMKEYLGYTIEKK